MSGKKQQGSQPATGNAEEPAAMGAKIGVRNEGKAQPVSRMPHSREDKNILRERAAELAKLESDDQETVEAETFIRFRLGKSEEYGITHDHAEEIIDPGYITPVPCTPAVVMGIVNRRGDLLTVLDLKQLFKMEHTESTDAARVVVVSNGAVTLGIFTDEILGENSFESLQLADPLPSHGVQNIQHVKGIFEGKVTILDMEVLIADEALTVDDKNG